MPSDLIDAAEPQTESIATRQAYGDALVALGESYPEVVALDADLAVSTQSMKFGKQFPERFFNIGAAEANMMSISCGLAATGKVPYASTFAIFATSRSYDQVRLGIAHNGLKVRIGASHGGVSLGEDGASHQMIEDIALMRAMPKMQVIVPADYNQAYTAVIESYERFDGPLYMRFGRPKTPMVYDEIRRPSAPASTCCGRARTSRSSSAATWSGAGLRRPRRLSERTGWRPRWSTSRSSSRSTRRACSARSPRPAWR